jgi:hypothetical protein
VPTRAFDTEAPRGTLKRFHPNVTEVVDITTIPDQMKIFDTLAEADAKVTVIDVRAGLLSGSLHALRDIGFLDIDCRAGRRQRRQLVAIALGQEYRKMGRERYGRGFGGGAGRQDADAA